MNSESDHLCPQCQQPNRESARFCAYCGQALTAVAPSPPESPADPAPPSPQESENYEAGFVEETAVLPTTEQEEDASLDPELPIDALAIGGRLANRYQIIELLPATETTPPAHRAYDLNRCPSCAHEEETLFSEPGSYCPFCGIHLETPLECEIHIAPEVLSVTAQSITHEGVVYQVVYTTAQGEQQPAAHRYFRLRFGFQTDTGKVREIDEDSLLTLTMTSLFEGSCEIALGLFVVSDGIGGHQAGEIASRKAIQLIGAGILNRIFQRSISTGKTLGKEKLDAAMRRVVEKANQVIYEERQKMGSDMGATVTAALVYGETAVIANVGDSRTYLWRGGQLTPITQDHSLVATLIAQNQLPPEAIYTHEQKSVIYRSLGDKSEIQVDTFQLELQPEDRLILCCDGVWEMIRDEGIEDVLLSEPDPQRACDEMVRRANLVGGEDNISVITIVIEPVY
jgi:serine/threonine protein phosphatase PrpC